MSAVSGNEPALTRGGEPHSSERRKWRPLGPVAQSMVSANHSLRCVETNTFLWSLNLVSANNASSNTGQWFIKISKDLWHYKSGKKPQTMAPTKLNFQCTIFAYEVFSQEKGWGHTLIWKPNFGLEIVHIMTNVLHSLKQGFCVWPSGSFFLSFF